MSGKTLYKGQSVIEIIKKRTSQRTYKYEPIPAGIKDELVEYSKGVKGPFDVGIRFIFTENKTWDEQFKLGTYGVIKNAPAFIIAAAENRGMYMEQLGYMFEKVVLYATSLNLGTCWMGGTFKKGEFAKAAQLKENEELPIVSPVGFPEENRRLVDRVMRFAAGSKNRKEWDELFFDSSFANKLSPTKAGAYELPLEMLRLAPSASNKQPWRIVRDGGNFHFYLQHAKGYAKALGHDIQRIDIGIAMCHFESSAEEMGLSGAWIIKQPDIANMPSSAEYIISWETR